MSPDLDLARRFIDANRPVGRILLCGVTGSHQYGFPSADSDIDLKGVYLAPIERVLGLAADPKPFDRLEEFEGTECDLTLHEAKQALGLLLRGNGNMLERILSPFQLYRTSELVELQRLARASVSRRFYGHYAGYFRGMCREHEKADRPTAKRLLYVYRVALTGTHLLRTGQLEANLDPLATEYGYPEAHSLLGLKREGGEREVVTEEADTLHRSVWPRLELELTRAKDESPLPESAPNAEELSAWLVRIRLEGSRS